MSIEIEARNLTKVFGQLHALQSVDLRLRTGEFLTIIGPNGAGKTTLLRCLAGLAKPTGGTVLLRGRELSGTAVETRRHIGFVSHETLLYGDLTAEENLRFYGRMYDVPDLDNRIRELLEALGLGHRAEDRARTLSRGMGQRLALARALVHRPSVLLLDEPHTGLDIQATQALERTLSAMSSMGQTVLMTTHNLAAAARPGSRLLALVAGRIVHEERQVTLTEQQLTSIYSELVGAGR